MEVVCDRQIISEQIELASARKMICFEMKVTKPEEKLLF